MTKLRDMLLVLGGAVVATGCTAILAAGCGGDDTAVQGDSGPDVINDRTVLDTGFDVTVDTGTDASPDAKPDVIVVPDASDGGVDAQVDAEAGPYDASVFFQFTSQVTQAFCTKLSGCCFGADAGAFNMSQCTAAFGAGYDESSNDVNAFTPRGHSTFNAASAQSCLADINALGCAQITTAQAQTMRQDCFGAVNGTLPNGAACGSAVECASGEFCNLPTDGGTGACAALRVSGSPCGNFGAVDPVQSQQACSYRGSASSSLTCQWADFVTGNLFDAGAWQCVPEQAQGAGCNSDPDCTGKLCDPNQNFICAATAAFANAATCQAFTIQDAGVD